MESGVGDCGRVSDVVKPAGQHRHPALQTHRVTQAVGLISNRLDVAPSLRDGRSEQLFRELTRLLIHSYSLARVEDTCAHSVLGLPSALCIHHFAERCDVSVEQERGPFEAGHADKRGLGGVDRRQGRVPLRADADQSLLCPAYLGKSLRLELLSLAQPVSRA
jgi:hypothetical protein